MGAGKSTEILKIRIIDSSLRDGEKAPGVASSLEEKLRFAMALADAGFMRLRYADTLGVMFPWNVERTVARLLPAGLPLEFHAHNDLGPAGANALAAVRAGASAVSGTVLGIGERAGNLALEEFVVALGLSGLGVSGIRYESLGPLCRMASRLSGKDIPSDKPIAGSSVYSHESGIHAAAVLKDPSCFQSFDPERLGFLRGKTIFGATSGRRALADCLEARGIRPEPAEISRFLSWLQRKAREEKCSFESGRMESLYEEFQHQS